ncbi:MAG: YceI family protein [Oligoflexia bacterium]|nr:YceI family protein [Oligoflexia bacterium]
MKSKLLLIAAAFLLPASAFAAHYAIDPDHSNVTFKVRHLAISSVSGRFAEFSGSFDYDPAKIEQSKTEALIKTVSIDTRQKKRDDHLRSPDFFDAAQFPEIKFVSKGIKKATAEGFELSGDLTMRGVVKPVVLNVEFGGLAKDPFGNERAAFTATTKLNRKDWGVSWSKVLDSGALVVGDEVSVTLEIEGIQQTAG